MLHGTGSVYVSTKGHATEVKYFWGLTTCAQINNE